MANRGCYKCGNVGHIAGECTFEERLCYNCRKPGHESNACPDPRTPDFKTCFTCGGKGHVRAACPNNRVQGGYSSNQQCYSCGNFGHVARDCRARSLQARIAPAGATCYRCGGPNHHANNCLAPIASVNPGGAGNRFGSKKCYTCQMEGHIARDCPSGDTVASV